MPSKSGDAPASNSRPMRSTISRATRFFGSERKKKARCGGTSSHGREEFATASTSVFSTTNGRKLKRASKTSCEPDRKTNKCLTLLRLLLAEQPHYVVQRILLAVALTVQSVLQQAARDPFYVGLKLGI